MSIKFFVSSMSLWLPGRLLLHWIELNVRVATNAGMIMFTMGYIESAAHKEVRVSRLALTIRPLGQARIERFPPNLA